MKLDQWAEVHRVKIEIDFSSTPGKVTISGQGITAQAETTLAAMDRWEQAYLLQMYDQGKNLSDIMQERRNYLEGK